MENKPQVDSEQLTSDDQELLEAIGTGFAVLRWNKRISAEKLSVISGISLQIITKFETGELDIDVLTLVTLTEGLKVTFSELFAVVEAAKTA